MKTDLPLPLFIRGKVRDTYMLGGNHLLIIATDRISTFDIILADGIPDKGRVLNQTAAFWFEKAANLLPNHLLEVVNDTKTLDKYLPKNKRFDYPDYLAGRSMIVKKAELIPIEWVIRGYLSGSAWEEYKKSGTIGGKKMPKGLRESQELPEPLFTPTSKAETGHDLPITMDEVKKILGSAMTAGNAANPLAAMGDVGRLFGSALAQEMEEKSLAIYDYASEYARDRGIIIADTKMEFGLIDGKLTLIDELLTPDSSRFWDAEKYKVGQSQPSFDKQPVRDWLVQTGWNKEPPAPRLTTKVIEETTARYREAYRRLAGKELE